MIILQLQNTGASLVLHTNVWLPQSHLLFWKFVDNFCVFFPFCKGVEHSLWRSESWRQCLNNLLWNPFESSHCGKPSPPRMSILPISKKNPRHLRNKRIDGLIEAFSLTKKVLKKNEHGSQKCQKICRQELQEDKSTGGNSTTRRIRHCRENDVFKLAGKTTNLSMLIFSRGETWGKGLKFVVYGPLKDGAKFDSRVWLPGKENSLRHTKI